MILKLIVENYGVRVWAEYNGSGQGHVHWLDFVNK
jgi:hypothetical protein